MNDRRPQIGLRISPELMARIEDWRATQRPIPTLADAARALIEQALDANGTKKRRPLKDLL